MSTFLELVNDAIDEGKISVDPLTAGDFANPPRTTMYNRIKRWVNVAYKELFMHLNDWYFRKERAVVSVWPRLHLSGLTTIPSVGDVLTGDSSGVVFTIRDVHTFEDVEDDVTEERTFSVEFATDSDPATLILREGFTCTPTIGSDFDAGYLKGFGRYDFRSEVSNLQYIDPESIRVFNAEDEDEPVLAPAGAYVNYIPYEKWNLDYELTPWAGDYPLYMTETPQGYYDFYPKPSRKFLVSFDYNRSIPQLVAYDDVPEGIPSEYHEYLMWKALEEYADFENNKVLFSRARKHTTKYEVWLHRDQKPEVRFARSKFDY